MVESGELEGYYDEKSVKTGRLLSIAQYDDSIHDKNGRCFEYDNGSLKSECVYENGVKKHVIRKFVDGKMVVYDSNGNMIHEGVYYGNMKSGFLCHEPMEGMTGFFKEVDSNNQLLSVSQYDELNVYRNGQCFELEDGKVKRLYLYESGEMKRVVQEGDLYNMILSNRIDSSIIPFLDDSSFFVYDFATGETVGIFQLNRKCFSIGWLKDTFQGVMVDMDSKEMIMYNKGEQVDAPCTIDVIDMNGNGRRWEGYVRNGKPCGYGMVYDEEGRKEYEGFIMDEIKVCYGVEYYNLIDKVKYEGFYYNGSRFGQGILYDRNGAVDYDGVWKNDDPYLLQYGETVDNHTESISIPNDSFDESRSFILHLFIHSVKRIVIGNECFIIVRLFELDGLSELESFEIGERSFRITDFRRSDGSCRIVNCPKLKTIQIGNQSFGDYHSFKLKNLPSLQSIDVGSSVFSWTPIFSLTGLID